MFHCRKLHYWISLPSGLANMNSRSKKISSNCHPNEPSNDQLGWKNHVESELELKNMNIWSRECWVCNSLPAGITWKSALFHFFRRGSDGRSNQNGTSSEVATWCTKCISMLERAQSFSFSDVELQSFRLSRKWSGTGWNWTFILPSEWLEAICESALTLNLLTHSRAKATGVRVKTGGQILWSWSITQKVE